MNTNMNNDNNVDNRKNVLNKRPKANLQKKTVTREPHVLYPSSDPFPFRFLLEKQLPKSKYYHDIKIQKKI